MKYCKKCKHLHNDEDKICSDCNRELEIIDKENTPVYLHTASGFELTRVKTALEDNGIPCDTQIVKKNYSADAVTGCDMAEYDLLVPYSAYEKAYDICVGIGAFKSDEAEIVDDDSDAGKKLNDVAEEYGEMSSAKRTTVKIISAILLIAVFCAVIWGTDYIIAIIKNLFN